MGWLIASQEPVAALSAPSADYLPSLGGSVSARDHPGTPLPMRNDECHSGMTKDDNKSRSGVVLRVA